MRTVIIHCHLFKNAGATLDWSLHRNFGDRFIAHMDEAQMRKGSAYLGAYLADNEQLCVVSSHHVQFPMPDLEGVRILPTVLLRHPIDRVGSVYAFQSRQQENTPEAVVTKKMTFAQYVMWGMEPSSSAPIRNFQTRRCCGRLVRARLQVTEQDFEAALQQLQNMRLLGLVERYDESMVLFEDDLRPFFPDINLAYVKQNVSIGRPATLEERVHDVFEPLGAEISAILTEKNQWDQQLYEEAGALLSKRIEVIPDFEKRLDAFRKRCRRLRFLYTSRRYLQKAWMGIKAAVS